MPTMQRAIKKVRRIANSEVCHAKYELTEFCNSRGESHAEQTQFGQNTLQGMV